MHIPPERLESTKQALHNLVDERTSAPWADYSEEDLNTDEQDRNDIERIKTVADALHWLLHQGARTTLVEWSRALIRLMDSVSRGKNIPMKQMRKPSELTSVRPIAIRCPEMTEAKISTYADSQDGVDLVPARTRLLFAAWIHHGPGFPEKVEYRVGPSKCGKYNVLWIKAEWDDENPYSAAAWMPRHQLQGKALHLALLSALFAAEQKQTSSEGPNFNEVIGSGKPLLTPPEVRAVALNIFGDSY